MITGLSALLSPYGPEDFFSAYDKNMPLLVNKKASDTCLQTLHQLPFLGSLEALLKVWPHVISAHLPDRRDESNSIETHASDAAKLYANGMGLLFNEAQELSPFLAEWLEQIKKDLAVSALTISRCLIYATPDGKGSAPHFDQNINFVLQLHGTKKWRVSPNHQLENPLTRYTMGQEPDAEMRNYLEAPLPQQMPADAQEFELRPGSLLFVPRGCWHETLAQGDALALNFTFTAPSWIDLFTGTLRSRLALLPEWRATADGVGDPLRRLEAEQRLDYLLSSLISELPHWRATDILDATEE